MDEPKTWVRQAFTILESSLSLIPVEPNEMDWKSGLSPNRDRLTEHLSAFANLNGGGFVVYGIDQVTGTPQGIPSIDVERIVNQLANLGRDTLEPPISIDNAVVEYRGALLLLIRIPEQAVKPVHKRGKSIEEAWVRSGGSTRRASRQEIGAMLMNSRVPCWEELRASPRMTTKEALAALDVPAVCRLLGRPEPTEPQEAMNWLADETMVESDGDGGYLTRFGVIAAARDLRPYEGLKRKCIRVVRYTGPNKVLTTDEVVGQKGYAIGFEGLIHHLKAILPHSEVIREALRVQTSVYPEIAIRELAANAFIHQDFSISGAGPMIEIFDDRIEFTNPGGLLPGKVVDRLIGTTPESRNELLASAFRRYRICEERGSGFQKVVTAIELFGLPPIAFHAEHNAFTVVLRAPLGFSDMSPADRIEACYQHAVLRYLANSTMTNTTLRERLKVNERQRTQVSNVIADAVEAGRIKRKDQSMGRKFAEYVPYWA
jgi:predicted HTH transcriptional regulator